MQRSSSSPTTISAGIVSFLISVFEIVERRPRALKTARGIARALRVVLGELALNSAKPRGSLIAKGMRLGLMP